MKLTNDIKLNGRLMNISVTMTKPTTKTSFYLKDEMNIARLEIYNMIGCHVRVDYY